MKIIITEEEEIETDINISFAFYKLNIDSKLIKTFQTFILLLLLWYSVSLIWHYK